MSMKKYIPGTGDTIAREEFIEITGIAPDHLQEIIALGWIETVRLNPPAFSDSDIFRVRKLERICCDFELPVIGGTIIVDLLDRIERLERVVKELTTLEGES